MIKNNYFLNFLSKMDGLEQVSLAFVVYHILALLISSYHQGECGPVGKTWEDSFRGTVLSGGCGVSRRTHRDPALGGLLCSRCSWPHVIEETVPGDATSFAEGWS